MRASAVGREIASARENLVGAEKVLRRGVGDRR
jgi:hypothetical protein